MSKLFINPSREEWSEIIKRPSFDTAELEKKVSLILDEVKLNGDAALKKYASLFDKAELNDLMVSDEEMNEAVSLVSDELKTALKQAEENIRKFHETQREKINETETTAGVKCWRKSVAIQKVGLYIPGGTAPLFSTVLMLGVPAALAGCSEIIMCTPCDKNEKINPVVLYAAKLVGVNKIYKTGGAQAIAAMAYGTRTIDKVFKIFGPGNQYVTCAKQLVNKEGVAIDMPAGPSEVAVYADESSIPAFVAADLLSQAEHGADSQVILVATSGKIIEEVDIEIEKQLADLSRNEIAKKALLNSRYVVMENLDEAMNLLNAYAPEHLIIASDDALTISEKVVNAGSVFLGHYSPESAGDYASGTNHTLPTNGYATAYSGVSLDSFFKKITFQQLTKDGLKNIGKSVELMASAEGLDAHKNAVSLRLNKIKTDQDGI